MADQEGVRILPREPGDSFELLDQSTLGKRLTEELTRRLGYGTIVARSVNGEPGCGWASPSMATAPGC